MSPYKLLLALLFITLSNYTFAQTEADINSIRQLYQKINTTSLTKQHFKYESPGCVEEGKVDFYLDGKAIVKISESGSIGDGSWLNTYYYSNGKPAFILETIVGGPAAGRVTKTEYRYYIKNGRALRVMEDNKIVKNDSKVADALSNAAKIYKNYANKDFAGAMCK